MIELYAKGTTDFSKNGIQLRPQESTVTFQDNGQFTFDMVVPAEGGYTSFDYGQIIKASVPRQDLAAISLGEVSYYTVTNAEGAKLYSEVPANRKVSYANWEAFRSYSSGDKVSYGGKNWRCVTGHGGLSTPPPNGGLWTQISGTTQTSGKVAATLDENDVVMKTADFNSTYMEAASLDGKAGYIKISDCTATGTTEERIVPARSITTQLFLITEIKKEQNGKTIRIAAEHISYQLGRTILGECSVTNVTPATALLFVGGAMKESYSGNLYTDMTEPAVTADWSWKNAQNAVMDPKAGLLALTAGRMIRDNLDVFILTDTQQTPAYSVRYGANMKNVRWTGNVDGLITRIYPTAQTEDGSTLLLPEEHVDTVRTVPFIRPEVLNTGLKIGQTVKNSDGTETVLTEDDVYTRMRTAAANRFNIDKVDQAVIKLELDWQHMPDTAEYAQFSGLKNAAPGEWVEVVNGPLGISELIRMTGYTWDPMLEIYKGATFGDQKTTPTVAGYSIKSGAVGSSALAVGAVGSRNIQAETITAREIEANAITADRIASRSITTELIMANAITANEITANAVTAEKIAAGSITTIKLAASAVTADKIDAGAITAVKIAANAINANKIDANDITAIVAKLGAAHITNGVIDNADIGYAHIVDASIQSLIARDAVTDRYYIDKLAVRNAQVVQATVGELVIKAANGNYYRLDVASDGSVSPTQVTLTAAEIAAGETSNGHGAIIETDLTVADLSASNMKGISALIDKITASRIDVDELWSRQAFINKLMVQDISSNTYIQSTIGNWTSQSTITQSINSLDSRISSLGYGTVYMQPEEPSHSELIPGDIWIQTQPSGTWSEVYSDYATWQTIYNDVSTWQTLGGVSIMWVWDGRKWQKQLDNLDSDTFETEIAQNAAAIQLLANRMTSAEGNITTLSASLTVTNNAITAEVTRATTAEGGKLDKTSSYQTADSIVTEAVRQAGASASDNYIAKTSVYQDAASIVSAAETYTNGQLTNYSTTSQTASAISAAVGDCYGKISGITITSSGIDISGNQYVKIASGGYLSLLSGDFGIDSSQSGICLWAGAATAANANFKVKKNGEVTLTKLLVLNESGTESEVNLRTAGLWKLNYHTIKAYTETTMTLSNGAIINFNTAASVTGTEGGRTWTEDGNVLTYTSTVTLTNGRTITCGDANTTYGAARYEAGQKSITASISSFVGGTATVTLSEPNENVYYVYIPSEATNYTISHPAAHAVTVSFRVGGRYFSHSFTGLSYVS